MSEYQILTVLAAFAFLYGVFATRLERTPISGAVVYVFFGLICGSRGFGIIQLDIDAEGLKQLAEFTLALVLFTDAANADLNVLRRVERIPFRLLLVGLPLTIALGIGSGILLFEQLTLLEIALLATMLAPTDAALGKAVVTNERVPTSIRESLNIESGLNDGICVPVLLVFLAIETGSAQRDEAASLMIRLPLQEIGVGASVGVALAIVGSSLVKLSGARGWVSGAWIQIPVAALAMACFSLSQWLGGSGFIGSFVGGLVFGGFMTKHDVKEVVLNGAEGAGNVMALLTWFTFGAVTFGKSLQDMSWQVVVYAILSLTLIRIVPVVVCLTGVNMRGDSKLFIGWFGPRGLASIVFVVTVLHEDLPGNETLRAVVTAAVTLSIIAHGLSAVPLAKRYGQRVANRNDMV